MDKIFFILIVQNMIIIRPNLFLGINYTDNRCQRDGHTDRIHRRTDGREMHHRKIDIILKSIFLSSDHLKRDISAENSASVS